MWWIIAIVLVLIILVFLKFEHYNKTWHMIILLAILAILYVSMSTMIQTGKMDFSSPSTTINSLAVYMSWLGETGLKLFTLGKDTIVTAGNVIKNNQTEIKR
jgi:low affinity Fe/Cu permease